MWRSIGNVIDYIATILHSPRNMADNLTAILHYYYYNIAQACGQFCCHDVAQIMLDGYSCVLCLLVAWSKAEMCVGRGGEMLSASQHLNRG
jgi:hypothetical protein